MGEPAISVEGVGKQYRIRHEATGDYKTLRDALVSVVAHPFRQLRRADEREMFWALQDVSFEVPEGEAVGIIGRNGAGKSTLLKVLSRVTAPTTGRIVSYGRMGSLLEVGTGFHPELTGRENVYLNGAILGLRRREIDERFDSIVEFAEVERFVDTPVKRFSSGMYLRLAFSVAAHLDPDILVVDEVLAVGDAAFQRRCLEKMEDAAGAGRTVLFVSHNMAAITRLCSRAILLDAGTVVADGPATEVAAAYLERSAASAGSRRWTASDAPGSDGFRLLAVEVLGAAGTSQAVVDVADAVDVRVRFAVDVDELAFRIVVLFHTQGVIAFAASEPTERTHRRGEHEATVRVPPHLLAEGEHIVGVSVVTGRGAKVHYARVHDAVAFQVVDEGAGDSARGDYGGNLAGVVRPKLEWRG
jgi:lipopolysaccharide transport system ATP-binding protein